jgi:hypothetical protein
MSIITLDHERKLHTDTLEVLQRRTRPTPDPVELAEIVREDYQSMRLLSQLLIRGSQGERNVSEPLPESSKAQDRLEVARHLGLTLMRREKQQVLCSCLATLAAQPSLVELLTGQARKEGVDIVFVAESGEEKQDFKVIGRLVSELPDSPVIGIGEAEAHLRYLPPTWQEEITAGLNRGRAV